MKATGIALSLEAAGKGVMYDAASKRILSYKSILAWILKTSTKEFASFDVGLIAKECIGDVSISGKAVDQDQGGVRLGGDERAELINSESPSISEGTICYDLRFIARAPGGDGDVCIFVNIEMQNGDGGMYKIVTRGLYYAARMISEQHGTVFTGMEYHKIRKVYSIWICPHGAKTKRKCCITRFRVSKDDVLGNSFIKEKDYDKMEVVVISLGRDAEYSAGSITGLLSALFSPGMDEERRKDILGGVYGIEMTKEIEGEVAGMCNLSSGIREEALREGLNKGLNKGRREGLNKGRREGFLMTLFQLVNDGDLTLERAAEKANMTLEAFKEKKREFNL